MSSHSQNDHPSSKVLTAARSLTTRRNVFGAGLLSVAVFGSLVAITPAAQASDPSDGSQGTDALDVSTYLGRTLRGASSISKNDAWVVGLDQQEGFAFETLTEHWDGEAWVEVPSPNPEGELVSDLLAVDAVATDDVWAVGNSGIAETSHTIIEHWDGEAWTLMPGARTGELYSVQALSADNVWAVGTYYEGSSPRPLTMHWDGTDWTTVDSPSMQGHLKAVSVVSADDVWAVGDYRANDVNNALVIHWDGTSWAVVDTPLPGFYSELYGVTAFSPTDVWAVGNSAKTDKPQKTIQMHWNGTKWTVDAKEMGRTGPYFFGMDAVSSDKIWAVGRGTSKTLTARYNGTKWKQVDSPSPDNNTGEFFGVEARTKKDVWAVGRLTSWDTGNAAPLIEHWDGQAWTIVPSP